MAIPKSEKRGRKEYKSLREMCNEPSSGIGNILEIYLMDQSDHEVVDGAMTSPVLPMAM